MRQLLHQAGLNGRSTGSTRLDSTMVCVRVMPKVAPHASSRSPIARPWYGARQGDSECEREGTNGQLTLIRRQHAVTFDVVLVKSGCGCQAAPNPQMMPLYMTICGRNGTHTHTHTGTPSHTHIQTGTPTRANSLKQKLKQFGRLSK